MIDQNDKVGTGSEGAVCKCEYSWYSYLHFLHAHKLYAGLVLTGPPQSGKTTAMQKMTGIVAFRRFVTHIDVDQWQPNVEICRILPPEKPLVVSEVLSGVLRLGRVPLVDTISIEDPYFRRVVNSYRLKHLTIDEVRNDKDSLVLAVDQIIMTVLAYRTHMCGCPATRKER